MRVNAMNNTVQTLDVDVGESTSKLVNWSLANWHIGETTVIRVRSQGNTIKDVAKANSMKSRDSAWLTVEFPSTRRLIGKAWKRRSL